MLLFLKANSREFMSNGFYKKSSPSIHGNQCLREPQRESFKALEKSINDSFEREFGIVLPVGCGKSGCIAIAPFAITLKLDEKIAEPTFLQQCHLFLKAFFLFGHFFYKSISSNFFCLCNS